MDSMKTFTQNATEIILLIFLIITFLQSALDKIFDWKGNLSWLKGHFSQTFLKGVVPTLLISVLVVELIASILCTIGVYEFLTKSESIYGFYGAIASSIALLMLLFGQRVAKDYDGARTIVIYFIPTVILIFILQG